MDAMAWLTNTGIVRSVLILGCPGVQALAVVGFEMFTGATICLAGQHRVDDGYFVEPDDTVTVIAARCGFVSTETLRRNFVRRLGVSADQYGKTFA